MAVRELAKMIAAVQAEMLGGGVETVDTVLDSWHSLRISWSVAHDGVATHLQAFRHSSATQAIAAGCDPVTVAGRLGYRDSTIALRVYSHALASAHFKLVR